MSSGYKVLNGCRSIDVARIRNENTDIKFYVRKAITSDNTQGTLAICAGAIVPIGATQISELEAMQRAPFACLERIAPDVVQTRSAMNDDIDEQLKRRMFECYGHYGNY